MLKIPVFTVKPTIFLLCLFFSISNDSRGQEYLPSIDNEVKSKLSVISIKNPSADQETIDYFREIGDKALPVIQDAITSGESDTRHRGVIALTYLLKPKEYRDEEYLLREKTIISMLMPLLSDEKAEIRKNVTGLLGGISWSQYPNIDPLVISGMIQMLSDEDEAIREYTANLLIRIGRGEDVPESLRNRANRLTID